LYKTAINYRDTQIQTASPGKLILLLYEGALKFSRLAILNIEDKKIEKAHNYIIKTQNIITELDVTLDMKNGGEIAKNLRMLYDFINRHLVKANVEKNAKYIEEVIKLLNELYTAWKTIINKENAKAQVITGEIPKHVSVTG
jgi:flagellar protein FliS